jgi:hypothetical protein
MASVPLRPRLTLFAAATLSTGCCRAPNGASIRDAGQPVRFSVNPQYDMKGLPGMSPFKVLVTIQLILPDKG